MSKLFRFFLISFVISVPFWWGANVLSENTESFFFWHEIATNPQILAAQVNQERLEQELTDLKPFRKKEVEDLEIGATSVISVRLVEENEKVLFEKNTQAKLPIASLSKLMTALIVLENYDLTQEIQTSAGEKFFIEDLLYSLLIESSNDAAYALAEVMEQKAFIDLMNGRAQDLGLENTFFANVSGLDARNLEDPNNYSTVEDLVRLSRYLLKNHSLIWTILNVPEFDLYQSDGVFHHKALNTNELLGKRIIGGKTGETPQSGQCLLLVLRAPQNNWYLINVILGSQDRFQEMENMIEWLYNAYYW